MRIAVLQRVIPSYRIELFSELTHQTDIDVKLFIGEGVPKTKVKNSPDLNSIDYIKLG